MTADDTIYEAEGYADDDLHEADIVEWYEARPVTVSTAVGINTRKRSRFHPCDPS